MSTHAQHQPLLHLPTPAGSATGMDTKCKLDVVFPAQGPAVERAAAPLQYLQYPPVVHAFVIVVEPLLTCLLS